MRTASAPYRTDEVRKPAAGRWSRTAGIAVVLCLSASLARAEEKHVEIPLYSSPDGTRARIEVSQTGNRLKAVPSLEIPRETARGISAATDAGNGLLPPADGERARSGRGRVEIEDVLERYKSLVIREGPEGVSLGNALGLAGEIREAVEGGKSRSGKIRAVTDVLRHALPHDGTLRKTTDARERPVSEFAGEPGDS